MSTAQQVFNRSIEPPPIADQTERITLRHPLTKAPFLVLHARRMYVDEGTPLAYAGFFLPTALVLAACRIVSQVYSEDTTYLSTSHQPTDPRVVNPCLESGFYYFHVSGQPAYDLCPDIWTWRVPEREDVPETWFTPTCPRTFATGEPTAAWARPWHSDMSLNVKEADEMTCVMCRRTGGLKYIQAAHIVPKALSLWYGQRLISMRLHFRGVWPSKVKDADAVNDIRNIIALSADCREAFDSFDFVHYPIGGALGTVYVGPNLYHDAVRHHMRTIDMPDHTDPFLLYIRFANTVFNFVDVRAHDVICGKKREKRAGQQRAGAGASNDGSLVPSSGAPSTNLQSPSVHEHQVQDMQIDRGLSSALSPEDKDNLLYRLTVMGWDVPDDLQGVLTTDPKADMKEKKNLAETVRLYRAAHPNISQLSGSVDG